MPRVSTTPAEALRFDSERLYRALDELLAPLGTRGAGWCVALSGGLDSTALLVALAGLRERTAVPSIRAIHIDHQLHPDSADWARACRSLAVEYDIACEQVVVNARAGRGESPEAAARKARYEAISSRLSPSEVLLTAHHADDQLETILLQWLRGGGLRAVAGMRPLMNFGPGWLARPLLGFNRAAILDYARFMGLQWQEDPSNLDSGPDRNYLRLNVLPAIRERWPAAARTIARVGDFAVEALELEAEQARADLERSADGLTLSVEKLNRLPEGRQRALMRAWLRSLGLGVPAASTLAALHTDMRRAAADRVPCCNWPGVEVRRYRGRLYAEPAGEGTSAISEGDWPIDRRYSLNQHSSLVLEPSVGVGLSRDRLPQTLQVRSRVGGERFQQPGSAHRKALRKFFQEQGVLPWRRSSIPVMLADGEVVSVGDQVITADWAARAGEASWKIVWSPRPMLTETDFTTRRLLPLPKGG